MRITVSELTALLGDDWLEPLETLAKAGVITFTADNEGAIITPTKGAEIAEAFELLATSTEEIQRTRWQM